MRMTKKRKTNKATVAQGQSSACNLGPPVLHLALVIWPFIQRISAYLNSDQPKIMFHTHKTQSNSTDGIVRFFITNTTSGFQNITVSGITRQITSCQIRYNKVYFTTLHAANIASNSVCISSLLSKHNYTGLFSAYHKVAEQVINNIHTHSIHTGLDTGNASPHEYCKKTEYSQDSQQEEEKEVAISHLFFFFKDFLAYPSPTPKILLPRDSWPIHVESWARTSIVPNQRTEFSVISILPSWITRSQKKGMCCQATTFGNIVAFVRFHMTWNQMG